MLIALIVSILTIIGQWKMFKKGGEAGWKSLIPFYSQYTLCKLVGVNPWWILIVFGAGLISGMIPILSFIGTILSLYFTVILAISTARSYGKSDGFGIATIFFAPICYLILGSANTQYVGPRPMNDAIMGLFNKNDNTNTNSNVNPNINNTNNFTQQDNNAFNNNQMVTPETNNQNANPNRFCPQCGTPADNASTFCGNCGNKL